ncbi:MAG TPA: hypothetical protein VE888_02010, partial [Streptosporangiaceae bacterium]|nr:hypothetical protein [Streptosporangiaceae bacterium]
AFDKPTAKALTAAAGLVTPPSVTLPRETFHDLGAAAVIDLIVDAEGTAWFLEVNVSPGMTETSTLPLALDASGHPFGRTCVRLLEQAAARDA